MNHYGQRAPFPWAKMTLGASKSKCEDFGCKMVSLSMMAYINPWECNQRLLTGGAFTGDMLDDVGAQKALGLTYSGNKLIGSIPNPQTPCIAEVDMSPAPNKQQHFVVWLGFNDQIIDPWVGKVIKNPYHIVSWRLFQEKKPSKQKVIDDMTVLINSL